MVGRTSYRALRAFIETVDAGSAAAAGRRLGVSPSAISHLIRELEQQLGVRLFIAGPKSELTEAGQRLLRSIGSSFVSIDRALNDFNTTGVELRVSTVATFAALWLTPRLKAFTTLHPDIRLTVSAARSVVRLGVDPFDCAIRWGRGDWPDAPSVRLFDERLVLVCAPSLSGGPEAADPFTLPRIAALTRPDDWPSFLAAAHGDFLRPHLTVEDRAAAVEAAALGLGVTVVDRTLASHYVRTGRLVRACDAACDLADGFHFVSTPSGLSADAVPAFADWMVQTIAAEAADGNTMVTSPSLPSS